jgi:type I restriction enzyme R subunit
MIGRGTRLCPDLFGPGEDKTDFRVFDFCFNYDFFRENPDGIEAGGAVPLGTRLFRARVDLVGHIQENPELDPGSKLRGALLDGLHSHVAAMNVENFIVRMERQHVEHFRDRPRWDRLSEADRETLKRKLAGLPTAAEYGDIEARHFDLTVLRAQLALAGGDLAALEKQRLRIVDIAMLLEDKQTIPAVAKELAFLDAIQRDDFWQDISLGELEEIRSRLRGLVAVLDKTARIVVFTDFKDEIVQVREEEPIVMPRMTGEQYQKKVRDHLRNHRDHIAIHKLRRNQPLTPSDLEELERMLIEIGEDAGPELLADLLQRTGSPTLPWFVRSLVGLDRTAAQAAFSRFLGDRSLTASQIRFIELIIDQLTARGVMEAAALYEPPFSDLHGGGPDELFAGREALVNGIFGALADVHRGLGERAG